MPSVEHNPDGLVYIRADNINIFYGDTLENFELDFGQPFPPLPEGIAQRGYYQGKRHSLLDANNNVIDGGPMPWPEGDYLITQMDAGIAAQKTRREAEAEARQASFDAQLKRSSA